MSSRTIRDAVDRSWSRFFGIDAAALREPGVRVIADAPALDGYRGIYLLRLSDGCTIGACPDVADAVRERAHADVSSTFSREGAQRLAGDLAGLVLGPSRHAYVDAASFFRPTPCDARRVGPRDAELVAAFRAAVDRDEWHEGGFEDEIGSTAWAAFEGGRIVAMGNMTDFDGAPADVGIVTHPSARRRGLGTKLAGAMVAEALRTIPVVRYRALETNTASLRVAQRLGFVPDGSNIAVRLRA